MPQWLKDIIAEWPTIRSAPRSFAIVTIGPVLISSGLIWWTIDWHFAGIISQKDAIISEKDTQLTGFRDRLNEYQKKLKVADPDQAVEEFISLRAQLNETKEKLDAIIHPPRDINAIYQNGNRIGIVSGPNIDPSRKTATFNTITVSGQIDVATNVEFRNLILSYVSSDDVAQQRMGLVGNTTYGNAKFSIVGTRTN